MERLLDENALRLETSSNQKVIFQEKWDWGQLLAVNDSNNAHTPRLSLRSMQCICHE